MEPLRFERVRAGSPGHERAEAMRARLAAKRPGGAEPLPGDADLVLACRGDEVRACCSLASAFDLHGAPGLTGMIGHYEALDREAGIELLRHALGVLAARHGGRLRRVLGPINGSTWMRYRLALPALPGDPSFDPPVFLGEPQNPFDYPEHFAVAGFTVAARYESRIDVDPARVAEGAEALARRVADLGVRITPLDLDRFDDELADLHALSFEAFADNLYYSPLGRDEFFAGYRKMRPLIDSELVLMAREGGGALVAFQFAYLDPVSARDGRPTRAVIKTVATAPRVRGHGLAGHMLDLLRRRAHERGCQATIHALMHVGNVSTRMSARHEGQVFRRYALYQWLP